MGATMSDWRFGGKLIADSGFYFELSCQSVGSSLPHIDVAYLANEIHVIVALIQPNFYDGLDTRLKTYE